MAGMMMQQPDPNDPNQQQPGEPPQGDPTQDQGQPPGQDMAQDQGGQPDPSQQDPSQQGGSGDPALDTAATAGQPQVGGGNPDDVTFVTMVAGLRKHIYGKGEQGIVDLLSKTDPKDIGRVLGEVTFALVREAAKQASQAGRELGMDILMGVATEVIDDIVELMDAHGVQISDNDKQFALLYAQNLYQQMIGKPSPDEQNAAKQTLAQAKQDGTLNTAVSYVQQKGMEAGVDPFGVHQMKGGGQQPPAGGMMGGGK